MVGRQQRRPHHHRQHVRLRTHRPQPGRYNDATTSVSLNSFVESGSGISIGTPSGSAVTGIHNNTFDVVGSDFNLLNVTTPQSFDKTNMARQNGPRA
jgi:hypothetical protein